MVLDVLVEHVNQADYANAIAALGLRVIDHPVQNAARLFALRTLAIVGFTLLGLASAAVHAGLFEAGILHAPLGVMMTSVIAAYGFARRFFRLAFDSALRGTFDVSVIMALVASARLFLGLLVALLAPMGTFTSFGFIETILLTAGWFIARAVTVLAQAAVWLHQLAPQPSLTLITKPSDASHKAKQESSDIFSIGDFSITFGAQIELHAYLRGLITAAKAVGTTVATGAGRPPAWEWWRVARITSSILRR